MYILTTKAFKLSINNFYHIFNEIAISAFYFSLLLKQIPKLNFQWDKISSLCMYLIVFTWCLNATAVLLSNYDKVVRKLRQWLSKNRTRPAILSTTENIPKEQNIMVLDGLNKRIDSKISEGPEV